MLSPPLLPCPGGTRLSLPARPPPSAPPLSLPPLSCLSLCNRRSTSAPVSVTESEKERAESDRARPQRGARERSEERARLERRLGQASRALAAFSQGRRETLRRLVFTRSFCSLQLRRRTHPCPAPLRSSSHALSELDVADANVNVLVLAARLAAGVALLEVGRPQGGAGSRGEGRDGAEDGDEAKEDRGGAEAAGRAGSSSAGWARKVQRGGESDARRVGARALLDKALARLLVELLELEVAVVGGPAGGRGRQRRASDEYREAARTHGPALRPLRRRKTAVPTPGTRLSGSVTR